MLRTYFVLALRSLRKNPLFTALNVFGLAFGLAVSLLLFLHVRQELSFDQYHSKAERICRVIVHAFWDPANPQDLSNAPNAVAPALKADIPAVEQSARVLKHEFGESAFVTAGDNKLVEPNLYWVDPGFFDIFDVPVVSGDLKTALLQPNTVVLSRSAAMRYFGSTNVIGKSIQIDQMVPLEVKAIYEDFPSASSMDANVLGAFSTIKWANKNLVWSNSSFETWVLLHASANREQVEQQMGQLLEKNVPKAEQSFSLSLQALSDVHLHTAQMRHSYTARLGDPRQVGILGGLALAVLLIACFNYMNLSTARSQLRFREVGINKTMGASQMQLATRFYIETGVLTGISLLLALGILSFGIPLFNRLADKQLAVSTLWQPQTLFAMLGIGLLVTLIAGSYPAVFLSSFLPKNLLQTSFRKSSGAGWFRRSLVTAQFTASVILIIGTLVLYKQMQFVQQKNLGFEPEQVIAITTTAAENKEQLDALMQGCRSLSSVKSVCRAQTFPGNSASGRMIHRSDDDENGLNLATNRATADFEKVLGIKILAGNTLPDKSPEDTIVNVVLNQKAVEYLGYTPEEAIGKKVRCELGDNAYIRGVVADFNAESLHKPIGAYAFHDAATETRRFLLVKTGTNNLPETMRQLEAVFSKSLPQSAFDYTFLDEHLDALYRSEQRTASIVFVFSLLSILICCLGLFGLAAFAAEQRSKEIGVRKALGASVANVVAMLNRDFLKLVLLAIVIATPISWYFMQSWLSDFSYHIELQWWMFVLAGVAAIAIAFVTVSFQSIRAALVNPVKSLRSE